MIFLSERVRTLGANASAAIAIMVFVALAAWRISMPGLQYDEVLFVQAAIGASNGLFIHHDLGNIPLMTMSYLGALKAWLYAPIFFIFGVSPVTIRLPAILLSAITLFLIYRVLRREVGTAAACLAVWLTALDTAFIFHSRLDWGPVVLATLFQIAVLGCILGFVRKPSWRLAVAAVVLSGLGMWDKLNFVWFLAGVFVAATVCYLDLWVSFIRKARPMTRLLVLIAGVAALSIVATIGAKHWNLSAAMLSFDRIQHVWANTLHTFSGSLLTSFLINHPMEFPAFNRAIAASDVMNTNPLWSSSLPWNILLGLAPIVMALALFCRRKVFIPTSPLSRTTLFFIILMVVTFFMIVITPDSGHMHQSHHMMMIHPMHIILVALLFQMLLNLMPSRAIVILLASWSVAVIMVMASSVANTMTILSYLDREERVDQRWSPKIYELVRTLNEAVIDTDWIISIDWGIHNQLLSLGTPALRERLDDLWLKLKYVHKHPEDISRIVEKLKKNRQTLAICYPSHESVQDRAYVTFFKLLNKENIPYRLLARIMDKDVVVYEVFEISGKKRQEH